MFKTFKLISKFPIESGKLNILLPDKSSSYKDESCPISLGSIFKLLEESFKTLSYFKALIEGETKSILFELMFKIWIFGKERQRASERSQMQLLLKSIYLIVMKHPDVIYLGISFKF